MADDGTAGPIVVVYKAFERHEAIPANALASAVDRGVPLRAVHVITEEPLRTLWSRVHGSAVLPVGNPPEAPIHRVSRSGPAVRPERRVSTVSPDNGAAAPQASVI